MLKNIKVGDRLKSIKMLTAQPEPTKIYTVTQLLDTPETRNFGWGHPAIENFVNEHCFNMGALGYCDDVIGYTTCDEGLVEPLTTTNLYFMKRA